MRYDEDYLNEQFDKLMDKIDAHYARFTNQIEFADNPIIDNARFIKLMNISAKTAQCWRENGTIEFFQIGNKIYYSASDIRIALEKHRVKKYMIGYELND